jgi:hypothetical protein
MQNGGRFYRITGEAYGGNFLFNEGKRGDSKRQPILNFCKSPLLRKEGIQSSEGQ